MSYRGLLTPIAALILLTTPLLSSAAETTPPPSPLIATPVAATPPSADQSASARITQQLSSMLPGQPDSIKPAALAGLYEVRFGTRIFYTSAEGNFLIDGKLYDLQQGVNLTEAAEQQVRQGMINKLDPKQMLIYPAKGEEKFVTTIFTDIDCPYCQKLHNGMAEMNEMGITVRYLFFPRAGLNTDSYNKAVSVWCAADRQKAMNEANARVAIESKSCDNPIKDHMALVREFDVSGTPAILFADGQLVPGYVPPKRLLQILKGETSL